MTQPSVINQCLFCNRPLYGPVSYCPYCGREPEKASGSSVKSEAVSAHEAPAKKSENFGTGNFETSAEYDAQKSVQVNVQKNEKGKTGTVPFTDSSSVMAQNVVANEGNDDSQIVSLDSGKGSGKLKWATLLILFTLIIGISIFFILSKWNAKSSGHKSEISDSGNNIDLKNKMKSGNDNDKGTGDAARGAAMDALRDGVSLSVSVSSLPKLEKVLQAAQKLKDISPRYQQQVDSAENNLKNVREKEDRLLMSYINKLAEISRHTDKQVSYAINIIQSSDLAPREKIVAELLIKHIGTMKNNETTDPSVLLKDFNERFMNYMD